MSRIYTYIFYNERKKTIFKYLNLTNINLHFHSNINSFKFYKINFIERKYAGANIQEASTMH